MSQTTSNSITGRDGYITAKALYWAIKFSQAQPDEVRSFNDERHMKAILAAKWPTFATGFKMQDNAALKMLQEAQTAGDTDPCHDQAVVFFTPPDLSPDPEFIEDGSAPTPPVQFIDDGEGKPPRVDHEKNRNGLQASLTALSDAVRRGDF